MDWRVVLKKLFGPEPKLPHTRATFPSCRNPQSTQKHSRSTSTRANNFLITEEKLKNSIPPSIEEPRTITKSAWKLNIKTQSSKLNLLYLFLRVKWKKWKRWMTYQIHVLTRWLRWCISLLFPSSLRPLRSSSSMCVL